MSLGWKYTLKKYMVPPFPPFQIGNPKNSEKYQALWVSYSALKTCNDLCPNMEGVLW